MRVGRQKSDRVYVRRKMNTGLAVRLIRVRLNLTQAEFSERTGISVKSMPDIESNRVVLDLDELVAIAKMLRIEPAGLLAFITDLDDSRFLFPLLMAGAEGAISMVNGKTPRVRKVVDKRRHQS
jgi:transcriptional regulator with XRE-family HTH domain